MKSYINSNTLTRERSENIFKLQIDNEWEEGEYHLYVNGTGGISFAEKFSIEFKYKRFVIIIQSDKAIYKPGQDVLFRVLFLDDTLRPVANQDISDAKINIIVGKCIVSFDNTYYISKYISL
jgi:hypothetical protein